MHRLLCLLVALLACSATRATAARSLTTFAHLWLHGDGAPCSNNESPVAPLSSGSKWRADLSGDKNIKPNTTGVPAPLPGPSKGTFEMTLDEGGQKASWKLQLCDVPHYIASHLHSGSAQADYVPPLIPLEPYGKPSNPFAPPELLPQLCPPVHIWGCSYSKEGSFSGADVTPLPGRQPVGDSEVPTVNNWGDFVQALKAGKIYINVHSLKFPPGLIRGNLVPAVGSSTASSGTSSPAPSSSTAGTSQSRSPSPSSSSGSSPSPASSVSSAEDEGEGPSGSGTSTETDTEGDAEAGAGATAQTG
ncbi:hypothetical protein OEZ85_001799 [Tetradesmus obliquus]|uniref:CHRD domain-containing protein n=1 Tax=Tetradesmus obliquus TaxID=3088 RepID=A0ABY8U3R4_TETOB|nr:hypothetical protein OEZ85_001799 [Tetradesmus obliquus]